MAQLEALALPRDAASRCSVKLQWKVSVVCTSDRYRRRGGPMTTRGMTAWSLGTPRVALSAIPAPLSDNLLLHGNFRFLGITRHDGA